MNLSLLAEVQPKRYGGRRTSYPDAAGADRWLTAAADEWAPDRTLRRISAAVTARALALGEDPTGSWWTSVAESTFFTVEAMVDAVATVSWPADLLDRVDLIGAALDAAEAERRLVRA